MSQELVPITGGVSTVETNIVRREPYVLSVQYIDANNLHPRPTEWVPGGRPIYRRLPGVSETYQIDFFYVVDPPNTAVSAEERDIGYTYVPWGESIDGATSMKVIASTDNTSIGIKKGNIVWKYGTNPTIPIIVNLAEVGVTSGKYTVAYQLVYDDAPVPNQYKVSDFSLSGFPLNITSDTDNTLGWRYEAVNAFTDNTSIWKNQDTYFPSYVQPTSCYLAWDSESASALSKIRLRCPSTFVCPKNVYCQLSYKNGNNWAVEIRSYVKVDSTGYYFDAVPDSPVFVTGWKVEWFQGDIKDLNPVSYLDMSIERVTVDGTITLLTQKSHPSTRASLVMYPENLLPTTVENSLGKKIPASYCYLANVDVDNSFKVTKIQDLRNIIHRDFQPVADWLTKPFDDNLVNLYEQVKSYSTLWMKPSVCMKQEYLSLLNKLIVID